MWTIIGYFIATGGTIVGAFYTYKQYKHSVQKQKLNPNASFISKKESQSQNTLERIINKPSSNNIASNLNDNSDSISDLIRMLTRIKDDFDKVNFIANYTQNFERKFSAEEVYRIVSVFEDDFDRNNAVAILKK